ncbi:DUF2493 domain-containing protein [Pseudactinotalea sp. HY160]|uniref:DUF2493 domain-containing protein n=1 Tax=Pseudactinotalea sp. HY160 TaxID=2654490 RepID=UPI00128C62AE|nr:DUF2493 domain-containing protein [Pseudactinotalea sp. HY160]MPV51056.1 DUF2493 domain-containing protein [Pseudactinotalea sp. HY160]
MRVLLTGSREWTDHDLVQTVLDDIRRSAAGVEVMLVHGNCPAGADRIADDYWRRLELPVETHPADWDRYGRCAGPIRNARMVGLGAALCIGFPLGRSAGTRGCIRLARAAGIPAFVFEG